MSILQFVGRNWKILLLIFSLGGTAAVLGVIPGTEGLKDTVAGHQKTVEAKLVSPTTAQ